jgi:hypothetical protein
VDVNDDRDSNDTASNSIESAAADVEMADPNTGVPTMPLWMTDAKNYLLSVKGGDGWTLLVEDWWRFERLLGYPDCEVSLLLLFVILL